MGFNFPSLIGTASHALETKRQRQMEEEDRASVRDMDTLRRALLQAQIDKLGSETQGYASTARAYIEQYPELVALADNPQEVIARGRARDNEALMRGRPVADYPVVGENGEIIMLPRERTPTSLHPIQASGGQGSLAPRTIDPGASALGTPPQTSAAPGRTSSLGQAPTQEPAARPGAPPAGRPVRHTGVRRFQSSLITPSPSEVDAAKWAPGVIQGFTTFRNLWRAKPDAIREAIPFLQTLDITASIPSLGQAISGAVRAGAQAGLSPDAQNAVQAFLRWTASRVFADGGKQLTQNEIRAAIGQYMPAVGEDPSTSEQRLVSMAQDATNVLFATGRAYPRIKANLIAAGAPDLGDFDPYTQTFTGQVTFEHLLGPVPTAPKPNRYGYTRPR